MADNGSQPGTSAGGGNVNNHNYGPIGIINQYNNLRTFNTHAPIRKPINNIELAVNTFIGRETELNDIKKLFHEYKVVVIAAMGGMGKTQLARKFAFVNADVYRDRYWINAETEEQLLKSFDRLAEKVNVKANTDIDTVRDTYRSFTEGAALLIFDNVEHVNNVYDYLPTRIQLEDITLHVLITSRWTDWTPDSLVNCYQLKPLNISTSLQIFQTKFEKSSIDTMQKEWKKLAKMLGYLPLALQVATSYIYKRNKHNSDLRTVLADYMKQLEKGADGLLNDPLTEYGNRSVYASMMLTLQQLENKADNVSNVQNSVQWKIAVTVINCVAYMNPDFIEKERLLKLVDNPENICKLDEALAILTEYSLLNQGVDWKGATFYSVHRIIQTSVRHNQSLMGTADTYYIRVFKCVFAEDYYSWDVAQYANEHAAAVAVYYKDNPIPIILKYLVDNEAVTAMEAVLKLSKNQIQSALNEHDLLHSAVENGDLSVVQLLCKYGANINQLCREEGKPPLHFAMWRKNMEIAKWLLENGAAVTVRDRDGRNALHAAISCVNHEMVSIIIKTDRAVVNETDNDGRTPLHAIDYSDNEEDSLSTTRILVKSGADVTAVDDRGNTVLHSVTSTACAAAVSLILQLNNDLINIVNENGQTALHVIPYYISDIDDELIPSTMSVLIDSGVDLTKKDKEGNTVLHSAAEGACAVAVELILQLNKDLVNIVNEDGQTALHVISYYNTRIDDERILSTMRILIDSGVDLTKVDKEGNTVLHLASRGACAVAVELILQRNNDLVNIVNEDGQTALHVISYYNTRIGDERILSTMRVLIESGVDLTKEDKEGNTVLHLSAEGTCASAVSLILQRNNDLVNVVNEDGQTALHVISYYNTRIDDERILSTMRVLIDSGVDLTKVDKEGNTVLHLASSGACAVAVELILQLNNDLVNIVNEDGETALHVISYYYTRIDDERILSTMRVLIDSGVDLTKVDKEGNTVLHLSAEGTCASAVSLILQLNNDLVNIVNEDGQTALHVIPYDDTDIDDERILSTMRVLIDSGGDLTKVDKEGNTVLHLASSGECPEAVELILQLNKDLVNIN